MDSAYVKIARKPKGSGRLYSHIRCRVVYRLHQFGYTMWEIADIMMYRDHTTPWHYFNKNEYWDIPLSDPDFRVRVSLK